MKSNPIRFELGCDVNEFKQYYESIHKKLTNLEMKIIKQDPEHLIVWRENSVIVGHALWHEASTDEHRRGDPRDAEDREILQKLFDGKKEIVELHEVWLKKEHRMKGYGKQFFEFFETLMRQKEHYEIAYYAYHPAALNICRSRGYREECCLQSPGFEGTIVTQYLFRISL
ncbi:MAG: GNAT family N-acetyltransferase [Candidatus Hodarchaeota archaeon]